MGKLKFAGSPASILAGVVSLVILAACGGEGGAPTSVPATAIPAATAAPTVAPTAAPVATQAPAPTAAPPPATQATTPAPTPTTVPASTVSPAATATPQPTAAPAPVATPTPGPTATQPPPATPTPEPTPAPELTTSYEEFGFSLALAQGADIRTAGSPSNTQGAISFAYGDVNTVLTWTPLGETVLLALVDATYGFIQNGQPGLSFNTLIDGEISADGQRGAYLGFKAVNDAGDASGGIIGSWGCPASDTAYTLTLTGDDTTLLQIRFDELLENFSCSNS